MTPIQIILIIALLALLWVFNLYMKNDVLKKVAFFFLFSAGIIAVIFPDITNHLAQLVGVGRGADLLTYLLVIVFYASFYFLYAKIDKLKTQQTEIIRSLAIRDAKKPKE